ncbi:hypothetical protein B0I35DRAFT_478773 [Stachybotrys elegans]|uniref:BZIP domain-containing protein n=1 Tax=Stachybotrys elegans TaxID=80388 RepID=A0A8K0WQL3_9HYPO|nr:hypothetical protein B0I35DRAFT_478773 [Stachybotrys elegans]
MTSEKAGGPAPAKSASTRIRDNQRRSRARRKEYLEDLQRKIHEYERRGVEATREMQQAARSVALENQKLRVLLGRYGVSEDDIRSFLQSYDGEPLPPTPLPAGIAMKRETLPLPSLAESRSVDADGGCGQRKNCCFSSSAASSVASSSVLAPMPINLAPPIMPAHTTDQGCCGGKTQCTMDQNELSTSATSTARTSPAPTLSSQPPPPVSPTTTDTSLVSPHEMSCTAAARIIAQMHGHGDDNLAKAALGCNPTEECVVKNTTLFQVLETHPTI